MHRGRGGGRGGGGGGFKKPGGKQHGQNETLTSCIPPGIDWHSPNPPPGYVPGRDRGDPGFSTCAELRTTIDPEQQRKAVEAKQREMEKQRRQEQREKEERDHVFVNFAGVTADGQSVLDGGERKRQQLEQDPSTHYVVPESVSAAAGASSGGSSAAAAALIDAGIPDLPKQREAAGQTKAEAKRARELAMSEAQENLLPAAVVVTASSITSAASTQKMQKILRGVVSQGAEGEAVAASTTETGAASGAGGGGVEYAVLADMASHDSEEVERYRQLVLRRIATCSTTVSRTAAVDSINGVDGHYVKLAHLNIIQAAGDLRAGYNTILRGLDPNGPCPNSAMLWTAAALFAKNVLEDVDEARRHTRKAMSLLAALVGTPDLPDPTLNPRPFATVHSLIRLAVELEEEERGGDEEKNGSAPTTSASPASEATLEVLRNAVFISPNDDVLWDKLFQVEDVQNHRAILTRAMETFLGDSSANGGSSNIPISLWTRMAKLDHDAATSAGAKELFEKTIKVIRAGLVLHPTCSALWLRLAVVEAEFKERIAGSASDGDSSTQLLASRRSAMQSTIQAGLDAADLKQALLMHSRRDDVSSTVSKWLHALIHLHAESQHDAASPSFAVVHTAVMSETLRLLVRLLRDNSSGNNSFDICALLCDAVTDVVASSSDTRPACSGTDKGDHGAHVASQVLQRRFAQLQRWKRTASYPALAWTHIALTKFAIDALGQSLLAEQMLPLAGLFELLLCQLHRRDTNSSTVRELLSGALDSTFQSSAFAVKTEDGAEESSGAQKLDGGESTAASVRSCSEENRYCLFMSCCGAVAAVLNSGEASIEILRACRFVPNHWRDVAVAAISCQLPCGSPQQQQQKQQQPQISVVAPQSISSPFIIAHSILAQVAVRISFAGGGVQGSADQLRQDLQILESIAADRVAPPRLTATSTPTTIAEAAHTTALRTNLFTTLRLIKHSLIPSPSATTVAAPLLAWDDLTGVDTTLDCRLPVHSVLTSNVGGVKSRALCEDHIRLTEARLVQSMDQRAALVRQRVPQVQLDASIANIQRRTDTLCHLVATRILFEATNAMDRVRVVDRFCSESAVWRRGATASFALAPPAHRHHDISGSGLCQHAALDPVAQALSGPLPSRLFRAATNTAFGNDDALFPAMLSVEYDLRGGGCVERRTLPGLDFLLRTFVDSAPAQQRWDTFKQQMALAKIICASPVAAAAAVAPPLPLPRLFAAASQLLSASAASKSKEDDKAKALRLSAAEDGKAIDAVAHMFLGSSLPCSVFAKGPMDVSRIVAAPREMFLSLKHGFLII